VVGSAPGGVAFDGTNIWVANHGSDTVTRLHISGGISGTFTVGNNPIAMAFDGANIWVAKHPDYAQNPTSTANKRRKVVTSPVSVT